MLTLSQALRPSSMLCCTQSSSWRKWWRSPCSASWCSPCSHCRWPPPLMIQDRCTEPVLPRCTWASWGTSACWSGPRRARPTGAAGSPTPATGSTSTGSRSSAATPAVRGEKLSKSDTMAFHQCLCKITTSRIFRTFTANIHQNDKTYERKELL